MVAPKAVKWGIGSDEPEDMEDFKSNDEILAEHDDKKPLGIYRLRLKKITGKPNKNGDPRINLTLEINEKDPGKKSWNGYTIWEGFNVTTQGAKWIKRFLVAFGLSWSDFADRSKRIDIDKDAETFELVQIGKVKIGSMEATPLFVYAGLGIQPEQTDDAGNTYDEKSKINRWIPYNSEEEADDEDEASDEPNEEPDEEDAEVEGEDEAEDDDSEAEGDDTNRDEEAEAELRPKLQKLTAGSLRTRAVQAGADAEEAEGTRKKDDLVELVVLWELYEGEDPDADEEDEEEEEEEEDDPVDDTLALRTLLSEMDRAELKARLKADDPAFKVLRKHTDEDLIEAIVDAATSDDEEPPF